MSAADVMAAPNGRRAHSPTNAIILAVVARAAPHRSVRVVEFDRVDRTRTSFFEVEFVAHAYELLAHPGRRRGVHREAAGYGLVGSE
jgi:hypothetical protein